MANKLLIYGVLLTNRMVEAPRVQELFAALAQRFPGMGDELDKMQSGGVERSGGRSAAVVDVQERDAGGTQEADHRIRIVDLEAATNSKRDLAPINARIGARGADRLGTHLQRRLARKPAKRMQPDPDDGDIHAHFPSLPTGRNAKTITSVPSASTRNGVMMSSTYVESIDLKSERFCARCQKAVTHPAPQGER